MEKPLHRIEKSALRAVSGLSEVLTYLDYKEGKNHVGRDRVECKSMATRVGRMLSWHVIMHRDGANFANEIPHRNCAFIRCEGNMLDSCETLRMTCRDWGEFIYKKSTCPSHP